MKKWLATGVSLAITLFLGWLLLRNIAGDVLLSSLRTISVTGLLVAFVIIVMISVLRGVRAWLLLRKNASIDKLVSIVCLHNMLINVLPVRSGELSFPYFAHKEGIPVGESVSALVVARLFDLFALVTLLFIGAVLVPASAVFAQVKLPVLIVTSVALAVLVLVVMFRSAAYRTVHAIAHKTGVARKSWGAWLLKKVEEALHGLSVLKSPVAVIGTYACSLISWFGQCVLTLVLARAAGIELGFPVLILVAALAGIASAIPVQGFAGFGTVEAIWGGVFASVGVPFALGVSAGLLIHVVNLVFAVVLGVYGGLRLSRR